MGDTIKGVIMSSFQLRGCPLGVSTSLELNRHRIQKLKTEGRTKATKLGWWDRLKNWIKRTKKVQACECAWDLYHTKADISLIKLNEIISNLFKLASYGRFEDDINRIHIHSEILEEEFVLKYSFEGVIEEKEVKVSLNDEAMFCLTVGKFLTT